MWERNSSGDNFYDLLASGEWGIKGSNLEIAQNHPILTPALLFVSKLFSQAEFQIQNKRTGKIIKDHWLIKILENPNFYQTGPDFLESLLFMQIAQGKAVVYVKKDISFGDVEALYLLNSDLIEWPEEFKTKKLNRSHDAKIKAAKIKYDADGENLDIKIGDLMFFYDLPNGLDKNAFDTRSRLDGLKQTLINTHDSLLAKNIILKTNGKELITGEKEGFHLQPNEKADLENLFQSGYGLGLNRKRGLITQAKLTHKSLHIALRDLGLDESVKVDGNLIYTALHIPKDILSLEAKKTTYNNFKESMVSYIQNEMQATLDSLTAVLQILIGDSNLRITGSYEHLPIMQFILIERYTSIKGRADALKALLETGIPNETALEMCGFDKSIKLTEAKKVETDGNKQPTA